MTKIKTNSIIYTLSLILLVGVLAFSVALTCVRLTQNAYADYESDIINNPQAIVNFNQYVSFTNSLSSNVTIKNAQTLTLNVSLSAATGINMTSISFFDNHTYYIYTSSSIDNRYTFANGTSGILTFTEQYNIYTMSSDFTINRLYLYSGENIKTISFNIIDLTQMFGANLPTLQECKDLFVSDYYSYNTGSAVAYSQINSYAQGVQSVLGSNVVLSSEYIINNANPFTLPYNLYSGKIYYNYSDYDPDNGSDSLITDGLYFLNGAYVPLGSSLPSGSNIYIKYDYAYSNRENAKCNIYSMNSKNELSLIAIVENDLSFSSAEFNYVITSDCVGIVFNIDTNDNIRWSFSNLSITYPVNNYEQVLQNAYQSGYISAKTFYDSYYSQNGVGYQTIYDLGYSVGINASATDFANTYYTFPQFLGALFDVPVAVLTSLLDFDVFGFNLKNLVFSLITLAIVFAIIRLILMKTGDK